jgi:glycerophosphoryl diester phosphodiesterase
MACPSPAAVSTLVDVCCSATVRTLDGDTDRTVELARTRRRDSHLGCLPGGSAGGTSVSAVPAAPYAYLDGPLPLAMAHRGGAIEHLENTMPAFEASVALGYRYLETDVRATADGVLVVFHDAVLERVTDSVGRIDQLPWRTVATARIGGREPILRLEELLGAWPDVRFNLDIKAAGVVAPLVRAVRRMKIADRLCLASFSDARIAAARRLLGPTVCTALGPRGVAALRLASYRPTAAGLLRLQAGCAQVPLQLGGRALVDERFVDAAHARGLQVHVWTVDTAEETTALLNLGVDGIMTDRPAMLREVLEKRGQWVAR